MQNCAVTLLRVFEKSRKDFEIKFKIIRMEVKKQISEDKIRCSQIDFKLANPLQNPSMPNWFAVQTLHVC